MAIDHATFSNVSRQHGELLSVAAPVDWQQRTAGVNGLFLSKQIPVVIEERDDTGVPPEIDGHVLEPRHVGPVLSDAGTLGMPHADMLQDASRLVEEQKAFIAATRVYP